jgi:luciferase-type oxidoreductase
MLKVHPTADPRDAPGFRRMFRPGHLTVGVFFPSQACHGEGPTVDDDQEQLELALRAQGLGYAALWCRDVPLRAPSFGDLDQLYDPWVWLGWIAAQVRTIALATGSIALPLRHPLHVAEAAASIDQLSAGRLVLGLASGDRPLEFPAFGVEIERRATRFREGFEVVRRVLETEFPRVKASTTLLTSNADLVPEPVGRLPMLVTGNGGQAMAWIARHADGWITCARGIDRQAEAVARWRSCVFEQTQGRFKPFVQPLYVDLDDDAQLPPTPIPLGFRSGRQFLLRFLDALRVVGVNHVILDLRDGSRPAADVLEEIGIEVLPPLAASRGDAGTGGEHEPSDAEADAEATTLD